LPASDFGNLKVIVLFCLLFFGSNPVRGDGMQTFWVTVRSITWGISLLCLIILLVGSMFGSYYKLENYRSATYTNAAREAHNAIASDVKRLEIIANSRIWVRNINGFIITNEAKAEADILQKRIEDRAKQVCKYSCFASYELPYSAYSTTDGSNQSEYARRIFSQLELLGNADHNKNYNITNGISHISLIITIFITIYALAVLFKFRTLGWEKILLNYVIILPFIVSFTAVGLVRQEGEYDSVKADTAVLLVFTSIIYLFVVYPPAITLARRAKIRLMDSLCVWRNIKNQHI